MATIKSDVIRPDSCPSLLSSELKEMRLSGSLMILGMNNRTSAYLCLTMLLLCTASPMSC